MAQGASEADAVAAVEAQRVAAGTLNKLWLLAGNGALSAPLLALPPPAGAAAAAAADALMLDAAPAGEGGT
jgi:hypothetical protein